MLIKKKMAVKRKINWPDDPSVFLAETYAKILLTDYDDLLKKESHRSRYHSALINVAASVSRYTFEKVNMKSIDGIPSERDCFVKIFELVDRSYAGEKITDSEIHTAAVHTVIELENWGRAYTSYVLRNRNREDY